MKNEEWMRILKKVCDNPLVAVSNGIMGSMDLNEAWQFSRTRGLGDLCRNTLTTVSSTVRYEEVSFEKRIQSEDFTG